MSILIFYFRTNKQIYLIHHFKDVSPSKYSVSQFFKIDHWLGTTKASKCFNLTDYNNIFICPNYSQKKASDNNICNNNLISEINLLLEKKKIYIVDYISIKWELIQYLVFTSEICWEITLIFNFSNFF
jgi:hypothetical protein